MNTIKDFIFEEDKSIEYNLKKLKPFLLPDIDDKGKVKEYYFDNVTFGTFGQLIETKDQIIYAILKKIKDIDGNEKEIYVTKLTYKVSINVNYLKSIEKDIKTNAYKTDSFVDEDLAGIIALNIEVFDILNQIKDASKNIYDKDTTTKNEAVSLTNKHKTFFKNTNELFQEVAEGSVAKIDIENYINEITENQKLTKLKTLLTDINFFIFVYEEDLLSQISENDIDEKIKYYEEKGMTLPYHMSKLHHLNPEIEREEVKYIDMEKLLYPYELFSIKGLRSYVQDLINKKSQFESLENEKYKNTKWFEVGLLFATGEIEKLIIQHNRNYTKVAKELFKSKYSSYRPYISESSSYNSTSDKNIFASQDKLLKIFNHCNKNKIRMPETFTSKINNE